MSSVPNDKFKRLLKSESDMFSESAKIVIKISNSNQENSSKLCKKIETDERNVNDDKSDGKKHVQPIKPTKIWSNNNDFSRNNRERLLTCNQYNVNVNGNKAKPNESIANAAKKRKQSTVSSNVGESSAKIVKNNDVKEKLRPVPTKTCKGCGKKYKINRIVSHQENVHGKVLVARLWSDSMRKALITAKPGTFAFANKQKGNSRFCCWCKEQHKYSYKQWQSHFVEFMGGKILLKKGNFENGIHAYICNHCHYIQMFPELIKRHIREDCPPSSYKKVLLMPYFGRKNREETKKKTGVQRKKSTVNISSKKGNEQFTNFYCFLV